MEGFILKSEEETIAVISMKDKDEFFVAVRTAVAEHYSCEVDFVSINMSEEEYSKELYSRDLEVETVDEDGETEIREFNLEHVFIY